MSSVWVWPLVYHMRPFNWLDSMKASLPSIFSVRFITCRLIYITHELFKTPVYGACSSFIPNSFNTACVEPFSWLLSIPRVEATARQGLFSMIGFPSKQEEDEMSTFSFTTWKAISGNPSCSSWQSFGLALAKKGGQGARWEFLC